VVLAFLAAGSVLALLVLAITGITRFMIRHRRSSQSLPVPPAASPSSGLTRIELVLLPWFKAFDVRTHNPPSC
jgi:hypothetical protein